MSPFLVHGIEWVITAILAAAVGWLTSSLSKRRKHDHAMEVGMQVLLRTQLVNAYERYHVQHAKLTVERRREIDEAFMAYEALGGNGTVAGLVAEIDDDVWIENETRKKGER